MIGVRRSLIAGRPVVAEPVNSKAVVWQAAVVAAGGTVPPATFASVNRALNDIDLLALPLLRLNFFVGGLKGCTIPQIKVKGSASESMTGFVAGDYSDAGGLNPGPQTVTSKYLDTGLNINADVNGGYTGAGTGAQAGFSAGVLLNGPTDTPQGNWNALGCQDASTKRFLFWPNISGQMWTHTWDNSNGAVQGALGTVTSIGFSAHCRRSNVDARNYRNGQEIKQETFDNTTGGTAVPPTATLAVFAFHQLGGGYGDLTPQPCSGYFVGNLMTNDQLANLYQIMLQVATDHGRTF